MANEQQGQVGKVVQVMGAVVDIVFSDDQELPAIYNAIHVKDEEGTVPVDVICETMQHLGDGVVRTVAMSSTDGMVRGMKAVDTGRAIAAPVGDGCLGRIFNVLGQTSTMTIQKYRHPTTGLFIVRHRPLKTSLRQPKFLKPASKSSTSSLRMQKAVRSGSSAVRV